MHATGEYSITRRVLSERTDSRASATPWSAARSAGKDVGSRGTMCALAAVVMAGLRRLIRRRFQQLKDAR